MARWRFSGWTNNHWTIVAVSYLWIGVRPENGRNPTPTSIVPHERRAGAQGRSGVRDCKCRKSEVSCRGTSMSRLRKYLLVAAGLLIIGCGTKNENRPSGKVGNSKEFPSPELANVKKSDSTPPSRIETLND